MSAEIGNIAQDSLSKVVGRQKPASVVTWAKSLRRRRAISRIRLGSGWYIDTSSLDQT